MNKAGGGDGILAELLQVLKDDAVKMLHSICQETGKTQQWLKRECVGPGLHLRPVHTECAQPPLQWTPNSLLSTCGDSSRISPAPDRGSFKIVSRLLIA